MAREVEEQYVLRVKDPVLAEELRAALRQPGPLDPVTQRARLEFTDSDRHGHFVWGDRRFPVTVLNLPSVVESYKTLDDINLVKTCDIGQVLVVGDDPGLAAEAATGEARDGITPPMRNARERIFRKPIDVPPHVVQKVEYDLLTILAGGAPEGLKFVDTEEEWVVDPATGQCAWLPSPVLVLAGFFLEELATVRQLLDSIGGETVRVLPTTPALLRAPAYEALLAPEPAWDRPAPPEWQPGGGWGQQRMALMAGIAEEGRQMVVDLLEEAGMPGVVPAVVTPATQDAVLGEQEAEVDLPVSFVDELPPLQALVPEVWQPAEADSKAETAGVTGSEVVQAEFFEAPRHRPEEDDDCPAARAASTAAAQEAVEVPLDIIDSIVADSERSVVDLPLDEMDSEELLAAARAAMGLDEAELQKLVDDAAVQTASALNVPFVSGRAGSAVGPSSSGVSRKPWETPGASQAKQPGTQQHKGFGSTPLRIGLKAHSKTGNETGSKAGSSNGSSSLKAVTEKHGLDFEELLRGLSERGIPLSD
ncbi:hypothetical protein CHLNCDRAFT_133513 [Chlorella variabilis]|uniref:TAFII55 protein conserved region domain-containing protein n=1 Tax=Chlorella variabilis TaxID=554065 RepID=E1Z391_CHLVA|nr:hypothetical protein CHLNCDRAFT_133513 [Chlorella variabilis]EFN60130.1 hypothetical protein CHLNCDRAFT_133513 [Chlorella variabilis]|eukprot:XP_005852232.1 hypothetical protein CHLNCDRAFT_133513 [Chlorella variabilis]